MTVPWMDVTSQKPIAARNQSAVRRVRKHREKAKFGNWPWNHFPVEPFTNNIVSMEIISSLWKLKILAESSRLQSPIVLILKSHKHNWEHPYSMRIQLAKLRKFLQYTTWECKTYYLPHPQHAHREGGRWKRTLQLNARSQECKASNNASLCSQIVETIKHPPQHLPKKKLKRGNMKYPLNAKHLLHTN